MADYVQCLINYGIEVTANNRSLDFKKVSGGPELQATLRTGLYSLSALVKEVKRALAVADPSNTYTITVDRTTSGGTQNRVTIATSGIFLSLLFATGTRAASSCASLLGFSATDRTGGLSYVSNTYAGNIIIPTYPPQDYQPLGSIHDIKSSQNEATSGNVETVSFTTFRNFEFKCKWIEEGSAEYAAFQLLHVWLLRGGPIEFTESVNNPTNYVSGIPIKLRTPVTLKRMTPSLYDYFETPEYTFREVI